MVAISAETSPEFIERAYNQGVTDFINRPFDALIVIRRVSNTVKLYSKQRQLMNMVANEIFEKERNGNLMVAILSHVVEFRNGESGMHVVNIGKLTDILLGQIAKHSTQYHLPYAQRDLIVKASALHDIGKISIDEKVLNKPGKLTDEEFEEFKQHTVIGHKMLSDVPFQDEPLIKVSCEIARWHHKRYDGRGYPDGLKGDEIPISAQVVSLADVYDVLTSERVYKPAFSHEKAVEMILNGECGTFNPLLLECLLEAQDTIRQEMEKPGDVFNSYEELQSIAPAIQNAETLDVTEYALGSSRTNDRRTISSPRSHVICSSITTMRSTSSPSRAGRRSASTYLPRFLIPLETQPSSARSVLRSLRDSARPSSRPRRKIRSSGSTAILRMKAKNIYALSSRNRSGSMTMTPRSRASSARSCARRAAKIGSRRPSNFRTATAAPTSTTSLPQNRSQR